MVTEDYCSFEIAKLLKEKGFDTQVYHGYYNDIGYYVDRPNLLISCEYYKIVTLQTTMKWLREIHKIHINLDIHWLHFANQNGWMYVIERILDNGVDYVDSKGDSSDLTFFSTYEEACERAIEYVLKNLI